MEEHDDDCDGGEWMSDGWWVVAVSSDIRPMSVTEWYFVFSPKFESQKDEWEVCSVLPDKVFVFSWAILLLLSVSSSLNPSPRESKTRCQCHSLCALSIPDDTTTFFTDDGHLLQKQKLHSWVPSSPDPFIIIIIIIIFVCRLLQTSDTGHLTLDAKRTKEAYSSSSYVFLQSNRSIDEQTLPPGEPSLASRKALTLWGFRQTKTQGALPLSVCLLLMSTWAKMKMTW